MEMEFCGQQNFIRKQGKAWTERPQRIRLTNAKYDFVDVHCGEVEKEEGEVYNKEREAQSHTDPLLQPLSYRDNKHKRHISAYYINIYFFLNKNKKKL